METMHIPVLLEEVLRFLEPRPGKTFLDGTLGHGGHAAVLLARTAPDGRLLGIERDPRNLLVAVRRLGSVGPRAVCVRGSYADMRRLAAEQNFTTFDGIFLDLGFSSAHVDDPSRGFSFAHDGPLDMRYDPDQELTAAGIVNGWTKDELARLFRVYGEEPQAMRIAAAIVEARRQERILTTGRLAGVIEAAVLRRGATPLAGLRRHPPMVRRGATPLAGLRRLSPLGRGEIHPATRAFQALRIAVNDELGELARALPEAASLLKPGGRLAVISFHSLEDRAVKTFFAGRADLRVLTKKPAVASEEERIRHPRARSAKLRVAERIGR